ncbi:D-xylose transport ATP-binding protein XylG [Klebsiella pneumoniae]|uniref:D-xylose transport ATP-binding protein XylG n=32 Tax=Gammaproteobacteria TaxID=1236 RepID=A0A378AUM7_KLEPO|nr:ATP-binding cassette domain-containing protein [Klebsiella pneumoniae]STV21983.1 D-xylose transport ATP-binding protein XylG [Klebsiella pneumoniae subsp. ozaenae]SQC18044.1 D-xylose transport ATP-binding protein XylG [Klebsiella pneumoniae]STR95543.1 D-xylose transport ATP-binding protein XylG [Klebsiella pneumoniae]STT57644.1 D-xylose transport ATP-binding protein XylG [Klebsiella pneumoniae]
MTWLLEMKNITKTFGAVKAVDNVSLRLNAGEVVSLCGENGSGKSTLMKVLCGIYPHGSYEGEIIFAGETLQANHIRDTERKGIAIIHQELALVKHLTVLENIFLGAEISRHGLLDYETMTLRCQKLLAQVNLPISPDTRVGDLGLGQQQLVEIAKALNKQVRLLILDEPTASLTEQETATLLAIVRDLQNHDIACIYISHKLNEVKAISDTICVIRDGQHIGTRDASGMSEDDIITMMVGRELTALYPSEPHAHGEEILRVEHLTAWHPVNRHIKRVNDVSFSLRRGEILGIAGLVGAGRTEAVQCLFGVWPGRWQGEIFIDGQPVSISNCQQAIAHGIAMVPEDRKKDGIGFGIGVVGMAVFIVWQWRGRMRRQALGLATSSSTAAVGRQAITAVIVLGAIWLLNDYRGVPTPVLILAALLLAGLFMATRTAFGRRIYAIGGNLEAARLSGINVERTKLAVFAINGLMVAIAGLILSSRLGAGSPSAGNIAELDAIAACVIGGTSLAGGIGSVAGAVMGAFIMSALDNGMSMMDVATFWQYIVKGAILLLAVWMDSATKRRA